MNRVSLILNQSNSESQPERFYGLTKRDLFRAAAPSLGLLVLISMSGCAQTSMAAEPSTLTPVHVSKLRMASSIKISPDGSKTAYLLRVPRRPFVDPNGSSYAELHIVDQNGVDRPYISGKVNVNGISWRPDGKGISFLAKRGKDKHASVYYLPIDGGEAHKILSHETSISNYAWHPKGHQIAFIAASKPDKDNKKLKDKGFNQEVVEETYKPKKLWVSELTSYVHDVTVTKDIKPQSFELGEWSASSVKFVADGSQLLVAAAPTPSIDDHYMKRKIHLFDVETKKQLVRFDTPGKLGSYAASPDGKHVAIVAGIDKNDPSDGRIMVANAKTGKITTFLGDYEGQVEDLDWADKNTIVYLASEGTSSAIHSISADGSAKETILASGTSVFMSISIDKAGKAAALSGQSPKHPSDVFTIQLSKGAQPKRLTNCNPWLDKLAFAKQEVVRYKARDGLEIEGVLIHPLKPNKKPAPLIVSVHGGPESHLRNGWLTYYSYPGQVAAAEGFAVFYPNYRGSTGRGVEYSKLGQADYAGKEFDDIIDGVDHLAKQGIIDVKKVGVTGGSYGGFASAWMATKHTKRFAASVMFVGISDQISKFGTTDIPNEMFLVHARKWPWKDWDFFRERSPITYVEQARTPILIMHGKNDTRVHPSQSMELFRYLKTIGKTPVRLVLYPGEGHGNRKAAGRYDYNLRALRWMKHYLQGEGGAPPVHELDYSAIKPPKESDDDKSKK